MKLGEKNNQYKLKNCNLIQNLYLKMNLIGRCHY